MAKKQPKPKKSPGRGRSGTHGALGECDVLTVKDGEYTEEAKQTLKAHGKDVKRSQQLNTYGDKLTLEMIKKGYSPAEVLTIVANMIIWVISSQARTRNDAVELVVDMSRGLLVAITEGIDYESDTTEKKNGDE